MAHVEDLLSDERDGEGGGHRQRYRPGNPEQLRSFSERAQIEACAGGEHQQGEAHVVEKWIRLGRRIELVEAGVPKECTDPEFPNHHRYQRHAAACQQGANKTRRDEDRQVCEHRLTTRAATHSQLV